MKRLRGGQRVRPLVGLAVTAGVLLVATALVSFRTSMGSSSSRTVWLATTLALTVVLAVLLVREVALRVSVDRALVRATVALRTLSFAGDESGERSAPELLDALAERLCSLLGAEWSTVSLTDDTGALRVESTSGASPFAVGEERQGADVPRDREAYKLAVPLAIGDTQLGVVEVGLRAGSGFTRADHELLRILADHLSTTIERSRLVDAERRSRLGSDRARAHLTFLAEVSIVLARALDDPTAALAQTAELITDSLADGCAIHLASPDGDLAAIAVVDLPIMAVAPMPSAPYDDFSRKIPTASDTLRRVMETGTSELSFVRSDGTIQGTSDSLGEALRAMGIASWVIAPIQVRGLGVGTVMVATRPGRRGLRPADQTIIDELANRMAIVIERSRLYQDARHAGLAAEQRATHLSGLVEATIAFNQALQTQHLLDELVAQASHLLHAPYVRAWLNTDTVLEAGLGTMSANTVSVGSALVDGDGTSVGYLSCVRDAEQPFTGDEESLLLLLARVASVALQNARLYDDLRVREERLSAVFAASPMAILELDLTGAVRDVNPAGRTLFGADNGRVTLPAEMQRDVYKLLAACLERGTAEAELSVRVEDELLELWISTATLRTSRGTPEGVLMVVGDTTARKRLEEQLIDAHRYEAIAQLAGGIAHDFNNLLTIIVGYSDLVLTSGELPAAREELTAINEAGQLAAVITNQLLMLSRRQLLKPVIVSLSTTTNTLVPMLSRLVGDRVTIESRCNVDANIRIDQGQLDQVLFNLVLNGRDAMTHKGTIVIETALVDGGAVALAVTDTGVGMDEATLALCREPFFTTKGRRGIGLGLATVGTIVERAGGRLNIDSIPGQGTTVTVILPVAIDSEPEAPAASPRHSARVLLVDDDDLIRRYASEVLTNTGYDVVSVGDAETALVTIESGRFDLLVSDVVLPGMSGFELARAVEQRWPEMALLLMTGFFGTDTRGTDLADVEVLSKPFSIDALRRAADQALVAVRQDSNR